MGCQNSATNISHVYSFSILPLTFWGIVGILNSEPNVICPLGPSFNVPPHRSNIPQKEYPWSKIQKHRKKIMSKYHQKIPKWFVKSIKIPQKKYPWDLLAIPAPSPPGGHPGIPGAHWPQPMWPCVLALRRRMTFFTLVNI